MDPNPQSYELTPPRTGLDVRDCDSSFDDIPMDINSSSASSRGSKHSNKNDVQETVIPVRFHDRDENRADSYRDSELGSGSRSPTSAIAAAATVGPDFPDGGLRAWLIVVGVSSSA